MSGGERVGYSIDRGPHTTTTVQPKILTPAPSGVASLQGGLNLISNQAVAYRHHTHYRAFALAEAYRRHPNLFLATPTHPSGNG